MKFKIKQRKSDNTIFVDQFTPGGVQIPRIVAYKTKKTVSVLITTEAASGFRYIDAMREDRLYFEGPSPEQAIANELEAHGGITRELFGFDNETEFFRWALDPHNS